MSVMGAEIQESQAFLQAVLDHVPVGVCIFDRKLLLKANNMLLSELLDLPLVQPRAAISLGEFTQHNVACGNFGGNSSRESAASIAERICLPLEQKFDCQRSDGTPLEIRSVPLPGGGVIVVCVDLSSQQTAERLKREFIATISHELRTPLTAICGSLGLLASGMFRGLGSDVEKMIGVAHENSKKLLALIDDLLDIRQAETGQTNCELIDQPLGPLLDRAIEASSQLAEKYHIQLDFDVRVEDLYLRADSSRIIQAIGNLLSNAVKFSEPGSHVELRMKQIGERVRVSVLDSGKGIPEEFRSRIFERFSQVDGSDSRQRGGLGNGLNICKRIIEEHGGLLDYTSTPHVGTEFYFELPVLLPH